MKRPVAGTIFYGLACAVALAPLVLVLDIFLYRSQAFLLALWLFFAGYALLFFHRRKSALAMAAPPLLLCLALALWGVSLLLFFCAVCLTLAFLHAWDAKTRVGSLAADAVLFTAFAVMAAMAAPHTLFQWAMVVWLFFLVQSAHFLLVPNRNGEGSLPPAAEDRFRTASRRAAEILERQGM